MFYLKSTSGPWLPLKGKSTMCNIGINDDNNDAMATMAVYGDIAWHVTLKRYWWWPMVINIGHHWCYFHGNVPARIAYGDSCILMVTMVIHWHGQQTFKMVPLVTMMPIDYQFVMTLISSEIYQLRNICWSNRSKNCTFTFC